MTELARTLSEEGAAGGVARSRYQSESYKARLQRRYAAERRFKIAGSAAIGFAFLMLVVLLGSIILQGSSAFMQTRLVVDVNFARSVVDPDKTNDPAVWEKANFQTIVRDSLAAQFPEASGREGRRALSDMLSSIAPFEAQRYLREHPDAIDRTVTMRLTAKDQIDQYVKGHLKADAAEADRKINNLQVAAVKRMTEGGRVVKTFNTALFVEGDSRDPEHAGVLGAVFGSLFTMAVTLALSVPIGIAAAIYLEEFAPKNRLTEIIEVNINNLAAVPSVVFGLLGLAVFLNVFGMPRSAPLVGGLVLALICLPTIIIAARAAMKAVPPSIREAAAGLGASKLQVVTDHVLPLSMPGILTGTILGMAHALGETAPLLMIGMVAFIVDIPATPLDPSAVLPVQVYLWADSPERAFVERTSAAIMVLLLFLALMNLSAILLRKKFERRW